MTRPVIARELVLATTPLTQASTNHRICSHAYVPQFLLVAVYRGLAFGAGFAICSLLTDFLGIFSLVIAQAAPLTTALIFILVSSLKFVALSIAVTIGLIHRRK